MDPRRFDSLSKALSTTDTRRGVIRVLAAGLLGALLPREAVLSAPAAQRSDRDRDGLYDDDEVNVYGTNPDLPDSDCDGIDDGREVFMGTDPLDGRCRPCVQRGERCGEGTGTCCVGFCDRREGICVCQRDGQQCLGEGSGGCCNGQPCNRDGFCGICRPLGATCGGYPPCCQGHQYRARCCYDDDRLALVCTDVTFVDFRTDPNHCGVCGWKCPPGDICRDGFCTLAVCPPGSTRCGLFCVNTQFDAGNCGSCGHRCANGLICCSGSCVDISSNPDHCGGCNFGCFYPWPFGDRECVNYRCNP